MEFSGISEDWRRLVFFFFWPVNSYPGCMAGLVEHRAAGDDGRPMHLFSSLHTTEREHKERKDLTITVSYDDGRTWPVARLLQSGPSAYSDLAL